jgi:hypothetical protein
MSIASSIATDLILYQLYLGISFCVQRRDCICSWITDGCEEIGVANIGVFSEVRFFPCLSLLYFERLIGFIIYIVMCFMMLWDFISYCSFWFCCVCFRNCSLLETQVRCWKPDSSGLVCRSFHHLLCLAFTLTCTINNHNHYLIFWILDYKKL